MNAPLSVLKDRARTLRELYGWYSPNIGQRRIRVDRLTAEYLGEVLRREHYTHIENQ